MKNAYDLRNHFFLEDYNTAITREDFEAHFTKTKEKVTFKKLITVPLIVSFKIPSRIIHLKRLTAILASVVFDNA